MRSRWVRWAAGVVAVLVVAGGIALAAVQRLSMQTPTDTSGEVKTDPGDASTSASASASPSVVPCAVQDLVLGGLLPQTGDLAFLGPAGGAAIDLALAEIDAAGGVLGEPVTYLVGDSGEAKTDVASQVVASQISRGAQAIVGPFASAVTVGVIDEAIEAGVVLISPANTSPGLTDYPDEGLYFRTVPSDVTQGSALAAVAESLELDSGSTIARQDAYGIGIQRAFEDAFTAAGGSVTASLAYDPATSSFAGVVEEIAATDPEFVLVAGFSEASSILREMTRQGIGPQDIQVFLTEGSVSSTGYVDQPEDAMAGVLGAVPTNDPSVNPRTFNKRLLEQSPELTTFAYAAEAYDATILVALAAEYAGCAEGRAIAEALPAVANANPGSRRCTTYGDCLGVIASGGQPNYEGVSGPRDFNEFGDPARASIEIVRYVSNTKFKPVEVIGPFDVLVP